MDPTATAPANFERSQQITQPLTASLLAPNQQPFDLPTYQAHSAATRHDLQIARKAANDAILVSILAHHRTDEARTIQRGSQTGAWLTMLPTFHAHTALTAREFRDATFLRYSLQPLSLPSCCDGCNEPFSIDHALTCKTGGLVILRHNELRDEYQCLAQWAYSNSAVWEEPLINPTFTPDPATNQVTALGDRGDLMIRGLFERGTDSILDFQIKHLDAPSYATKDPKSVLLQAERDKKSHYQAACEAQRRTFIPCIASVDGLLGKEFQEVNTRLATRLASKWREPYSQVKSFVNRRISLALIRSLSLCIRGSRIHRSKIALPSSLQDDAYCAFVSTTPRF